MSSPTSDVDSALKSQFIRAGAGAGKTTQLIRSFTDFVKQFYQLHQRYPRIVITTFTRKATQEVKERLLVNALQNEDQNIFQFINKKSFVQISTIHGLLSLYLSQNAEQLSLPQEIKIVDQAKSQRVLKKLMHSLFKSKTEYIEILETYAFKDLLKIAEEALNYFAQHDHIQHIQISELQNLTDFKKNLVLQKLQQIFHRVPVAPEKWRGYFEFLETYQTQLQTGTIDELIHYFDDEVSKPNFLKKSPAFEQEVHDLIEEIRKKDLFTFQDTNVFREQHEKLNQLFFNFMKSLAVLDLETKKRTGELTIADLENLSLKLVTEFPQTAIDFSNTWDFFMIDEYQDTSPLQVKILNRLVGLKPCFIVGDPQQSIYLFRGARSEVFDQKESEMQKNQVQIRKLETNYRSEPLLMSFINDFFTQLSPQFSPMQEKSHNNQAMYPTQAYYIKTSDETTAVLKQIQNFLKQGIAPKEICVLSKKNSSLIEIARAAYIHQIPVQLQTVAGFESKREIIDLVSFIQFLINPHDQENLITLLRSPWMFVEDFELFHFCQSEVSRQQSLWLAILQSTHTIKTILLEYQKMFVDTGVSCTLKSFIEKTGFLSFSELLDPTGKREANIWKFILLLNAAEKQSDFSIALFIQEQFQALQSDLGSSAGEAQPVIQPDCVSLMTVHAAKGLQFKHVIVIGLTNKPQQTNTMNLAFDPLTAKLSLAIYHDAESKLVSSAWSQSLRKEFNIRELLEADRVLYVAMTRAERSISLIADIGSETKKKIIYNESWFKKINWPEESMQKSNYQIVSTHYDETVSSQIESKKRDLNIPNKFVQKNIQPQNSETSSVTGLLSEKKLSLNLKSFDKSLLHLKKAQKGTELHQLFESLKYKNVDQLLLEVPDETKKMLTYLIHQKDINLTEILSQGFNEWGFGLRNKTGLMQGQIDAWAELKDEIHVLDYKTGSSEYSDKAFQQLTIYAFALLKMQKISKTKKIIFSVIYPTEQKIIKKEFINAADLIDKEFQLSQLF